MWTDEDVEDSEEEMEQEEFDGEEETEVETEEEMDYEETDGGEEQDDFSTTSSQYAGSDADRTARSPSPNLPLRGRRNRVARYVSFEYICVVEKNLNCFCFFVLNSGGQFLKIVTRVTAAVTLTTVTRLKSCRILVVFLSASVRHHQELVGLRPSLCKNVFFRTSKNCIQLISNRI